VQNDGSISYNNGPTAGGAAGTPNSRYTVLNNASEQQITNLASQYAEGRVSNITVQVQTNLNNNGIVARDDAIQDSNDKRYESLEHNMQVSGIPAHDFNRITPDIFGGVFQISINFTLSTPNFMASSFICS